MRKGRKEQGQFHNRPNIALRLAAILLVLVCLSVWMMNGLFAKYRTSDEGGDGARVITFGALSLIEEGNFLSGPAPIIPGVDLIKDVTIDFTGSEAATYVFVEVDLPGGHWTRTPASETNCDVYSALSDRVSWEVAAGWTYLQQPGDPSPYIYYVELGPNDTLNKKFIAGADKTDATSRGVVKVSETLVKRDMADISAYETPITINLRAVVVQRNGFESPLAAWQSILAGRN